jgi:hypothetical protein
MLTTRPLKPLTTHILKTLNISARTVRIFSGWEMSNHLSARNLTISTLLVFLGRNHPVVCEQY